MIQKITLLYLTIFCGLGIVANAQNIRGRVLDNSGKTIDLATIVLSENKASNKYISYSISDSLGYFSLDCKNKSFGYINVSHLGYKNFSKRVEFTSQNEYIEILLEPLAQNLGEVTVVGDRSFITSIKKGAKIYHLSSNAAKMKNIYSSLQEIPELIVNVAEQKINLVEGGKPLILINGIYTGQDLMTLSSADIDNVEIKNSVSQEYRHLGYSCTLNIQTKKNKEKYYTTNFGIYTHPKAIFGIADLSSSFGTNKYSLFGTIRGFGFFNNKSMVSEQIYGKQYLWTQEAPRLSDYKNLSIALGGHIKWKPNVITSIGIVYGTQPQQYKSENNIKITTIEDNSSNYDYSRFYEDHLNGYTINLYHSHQITNIGNLSIYGSFYDGINKNNTVNTLDNSFVNKLDTKKQVLYSDLKELNAGIKYNNNLAWGNIEVGNNLQHRNSFITRNNEKTSSSQLKNYLYAEYIKQIGHWDLLCSLGWDMFVSNYINKSYIYHTILPIISINYKKGKNNIRLLYQKEHIIPSIIQLSSVNSSYLFMTNIYGNPNLKPENLHSIKLSYDIANKFYNLHLYLKNDLTQDKIHMITLPSSIPNTTIGFSNSNYLFWTTDLGTIVRLRYQGVSLNLQGGYRITSYLNKRENNFFGGMQLNYIWKKLYTSLSLSLPYITRSIDSYQKSSSESQFNLTYSINNWLDCNLGLRYIFSKKSFEKTESLENYSYHYVNQFLNRGNIILFGFRIKLSSRKSTPNWNKSIIEEKEHSRILSD